MNKLSLLSYWTVGLHLNASLFIVLVSALDCFKCTSVDGSNPPCEDPFHHNTSTSLLHTPCWAGRKERDGVFPATHCIKLNGVFTDTGESMVVRGCALDSGTVTTDTELVRMSHCGGFYFDDRYVSGCVQSCLQPGCNSAIRATPVVTFPFTIVLIPSLIVLMSSDIACGT